MLLLVCYFKFEVAVLARIGFDFERVIFEYFVGFWNFSSTVRTGSHDKVPSAALYPTLTRRHPFEGMLAQLDRTKNLAFLRSIRESVGVD
jgi:hypothetical protein